MKPEAPSDSGLLPGAQVAITALAMLAAAYATTQTAQAHCDSLNGPVIAAARVALKENNVKPVLIWVKEGDHFPETATPAVAHPHKD